MNTELAIAFAACYWAACWCMLGYAIGRRIDEGAWGAWLGLLLGPLGCAIVFSWPPDEEKSNRERLLNASARRSRSRLLRVCPYCGRPVSGTGLVTCHACGQQSEQA